MGSRTNLQSLLESILDSQNVYFQPPESLKLSYPCIIYGRSDVNINYADDGVYSHKIRYNVTLIDKNPDSTILEKLVTLPLCSYDRHYKAENLNHDTFTIYY